MRAERTVNYEQVKKSKQGLGNTEAPGNLGKVVFSGIQKLDERTKEQRGYYVQLISGEARFHFFFSCSRTCRQLG